MSDKKIYNFPVENGWPASGVNMGLAAHQVNFHYTSGVNAFTNSFAPSSQNNYPATNINSSKVSELIKFKPELCSPYNGQADSFDMDQTDDHASKQTTIRSYSQMPVTGHAYSQVRQIVNSISPEITFQGNYSNHISPASVANENSMFASHSASQMSFVDVKSNYNSNGCLSNELQNVLHTLPNNPATDHVPFHNPQSFHNLNINNNFHQRFPSAVPSQQPVNVQYFQKNCGPMYNMPPPSIMPVGNSAVSDSTIKYEEPNQSGHFRFLIPSNQHFPPNLCNEKPLPNNIQFQQSFNNVNTLLPSPTFRDPPPYPFHSQSVMTQIPNITQTEGRLNQADTAPMVLSVISKKESMLASFLQKFHQKRKINLQTDITVVEFCSNLKLGFALSKKLQSSRTKLTSLLHTSEAEWKTEMKHATQLQKQLSEVCCVLSIPSNLNTIQRKLRLIKRKRELKFKLKQEALSMKSKQQQEREYHSQEIDKWLDSIKEKNLKLKREVEMKVEADNILSEVRRKIQEAKRAIEKLKVFEKLRMVRQTNAEQKGMFVSPEHNEQFEGKISELRALMHSQLQDYEAEERALRVMLETEQEGQLEQEAQWRVRKGRTLQQRKQKNILECLFGDSEEPLPEDHLFFFFQHHNSGNTSIDNLVQIRHHWDVHLAEVGKPVPQKWVVPVPASNPSWEGVCKE